MARENTKSLTISNDHHTKLVAIGGKQKDTVEYLIDCYPLIKAVNDRGLTLESAINQINAVDKALIDMIPVIQEFMPVIEAIKAKEFNAEQAIEKINAEPVKKSIALQSTNRTKFAEWLEKLIAHNESAKQRDRVYITQRLFLNLIGGNVNTISDEFKQHESEIRIHNEKMKTDDSTNRAISHRVRKEYGNVSEWLKAILA